MLHELRGSLRGYMLSRHAAQRLKERGFLARDLGYIIDHGQAFDTAGGLLCFYLAESPFSGLVGDSARVRLAGSALILDPRTKTIVTVYWNNSLEPIQPQGWSA